MNTSQNTPFSFGPNFNFNISKHIENEVYCGMKGKEMLSIPKSMFFASHSFSNIISFFLFQMVQCFCEDNRVSFNEVSIHTINFYPDKKFLH